MEFRKAKLITLHDDQAVIYPGELAEVGWRESPTDQPGLDVDGEQLAFLLEHLKIKTQDRTIKQEGDVQLAYEDHQDDHRGGCHRSHARRDHRLRSLQRLVGISPGALEYTSIAQFITLLLQVVKKACNCIVTMTGPAHSLLHTVQSKGGFYVIQNS
jgi:hypothetical protein